MATARQSRAARGAQAAAADSTTKVVPITSGGRSATGDNGGGRAPAKPAAPAKTTPPAKPTQPKTTVGVETYQKPFYRPVVDGKPVHCEHDPVDAGGKPTGKYGHDGERAALACARKIAASTA